MKIVKTVYCDLANLQEKERRCNAENYHDGNKTEKLLSQLNGKPSNVEIIIISFKESPDRYGTRDSVMQWTGDVYKRQELW